jgi:hypothetical protein
VEWLFEQMETEITVEGSVLAGRPRAGRWKTWRDEETRTFRIANSARDTNDEFGVTMFTVADLDRFTS